MNLCRLHGALSTSVVLIVFALSVMGCKDSPPPLPIEEDKLVEVLTDVQIAEAALRQTPSFDKDSIARLYYERIMAIHGVQQADFDTALVRLHRYPELGLKIYARVQQRLDSLSQIQEND